MKKYFSLALVCLPLLLAGCSHPHPVAYYPPPPALTEIARQGFHDGAMAAQRDMRAGLPPDVGRHPRFRRPPAPPPAWEDYRHGFRDGYEGTIRPNLPPPGA